MPGVRSRRSAGQRPDPAFGNPHHREPIETTNLDTIYGSPTIPGGRPRDLLGTTISCVNGGNFGNKIDGGLAPGASATACSAATSA